MMLQKNPKNDSLTLRINSMVKEFLYRAAETSGKDRTEFILDAAFEKAEEVMLDQRFMMMDEAQWDALTQILDAPPAPNEKLKTLLAMKAPWE